MCGRVGSPVRSTCSAPDGLPTAATQRRRAPARAIGPAEGAPFQDKARIALVGLAPNEKLSISRQVLREYVAVMIRPQTWGRPLGLTEAMADARAFANRFGVLEDGPTVWNQLSQLSRRYTFAGREIHDANIVATMLAHGGHRLLTFNTGDLHQRPRELTRFRHGRT